MTLLWADKALRVLQELQQSNLPKDAYTRLVRRLALLENDASTFEALYESAAPDGSTLRAHVMEADPGRVFIIWYRLVTDAEDVWLVGLTYGQ